MAINSIKLSPLWMKVMSNLPETSMGSQNVLVKIKHGKSVMGLVLNGEVLETIFPISVSDIEDIIIQK